MLMLMLVLVLVLVLVLTAHAHAHAPTAWFLPVGLQVPLPEELKDIAT